MTIFVEGDPSFRETPYPRRRRPENHLPPWRKFPDATRDYTAAWPTDFDATLDFADSAVLTVAPSGVNELAVSALDVRADGITFIAAGGQPRRVYTLRFVIVMTNGQVFELVGEMIVEPVLETDRPSPPTSADFGPPLPWKFVSMLDFSNPGQSGLLILI